MSEPTGEQRAEWDKVRARLQVKQATMEYWLDAESAAAKVYPDVLAALERAEARIKELEGENTRLRFTFTPVLPSAKHWVASTVCECVGSLRRTTDTGGRCLTCGKIAR